ncbi:unnamed protein product [Penicillium olsonii]|nr:unnamed protein product [Penicillium olsonii]CAG7934673.1 unnamed protein product [Penicillium olsonii]CAG8129884.1 unnamed protein product [Penicillium olsonii]
MPRGSPNRNHHLISVLNSPSASSLSPSSSPEPQQLSSDSNMGRKNMRSSPQEDNMPVTYTPTTHRISKAKKGKRVHACQHDGCGKVFTRAEHKRRHELNHNPEASYRCTQPGCKKTFHRTDLLARHIERHELESQTEQPSWAPKQEPMLPESAIPRCMAMGNGLSLTAAPQPNTMSIGSVVAPGIHPDLVNDCSLMWSGVDLPLQPRPTFHNHLSEAADDSPFYSSPAETCPSPLSDTTFSRPSHSGSMSSTSTSIMDHYSKTMFKSDIHTSPLQAPALLRWDPDTGMPPSHLVPMSMGENLIQPPDQCHYPSPSWSNSECLPYEDHVPTMPHFHSAWGM